MKKKAIQFKDLAAPLSVSQYWIASLTVPLIFQFFTWSSSFDDLHTFLMAYSWYTIVGMTQGLGHGYIGIQLDKILSWEKQPYIRLVVTIVAIVGYAVLAYLVVGTILAYFWIPKPFSYAVQVAMQGVWIATKISFLFAFLFASISFFVNWQKTKLQAERLQKELANYRYTTLKNQINPHFLFNSLNVLTDLVHEDADLSEKYIHQLSNIYRYVLDSTNHKLVPLTDELTFIESYVFLLKIRFGDKLIVNMDVAAEPDDYIVPVALQMLIENAVKHNQVTKDTPLKVNIVLKDGFVVVFNKVQPKIAMPDSIGIGLENLKKQYALNTERQILVKQDETTFSVHLPIIYSKDKL